MYMPVYKQVEREGERERKSSPGSILGITERGGIIFSPRGQLCCSLHITLTRAWPSRATAMKMAFIYTIIACRCTCTCMKVKRMYSGKHTCTWFIILYTCILQEQYLYCTCIIREKSCITRAYGVVSGDGDDDDAAATFYDHYLHHVE